MLNIEILKDFFLFRIMVFEDPPVVYRVVVDDTVIHTHYEALWMG